MKRDPYRPLHKAIRSRLFDVGNLAGTTDFADQQSVRQFQVQFAGLDGLLTHHGEHEDAHIHPLLEKYGLAKELAQLEEQHQALDQAFDALRTMLENLISNTAENKWDDVHQFYLQYHRFVSRYLAHLHNEEMIALPLLHRHCTDEDFDQLAEADFGHEDPLALQPMLGGMFISFNTSDLALLLSDIQRVVSDETFKQFCGVFQQELSTHSWEKVKALLQPG